MMITKGSRRSHKYAVFLTTQELLNIANDHSLSDWFYVNQLRDLIRKEADRLGKMPSE